jgi:hypothetical protein
VIIKSKNTEQKDFKIFQACQKSQCKVEAREVKVSEDVRSIKKKPSTLHGTIVKLPEGISGIGQTLPSRS